MSDDTRQPESVAGALGVGAVLLVALLTGLAVIGRRARTLAPAETFAGWFAPGELPFGLVPLEAARQADGEVLLRLSNPGAPPEAERVEPPAEDGEEGEDAPTGDDGDGAEDGADEASVPERFDWRAIPIGEQGTPPTEALFVTWPLAAARGQLESLFEPVGAEGPQSLREQSRAVDPLAGLGPEGGRCVLARGRLPWGAFEAPFVLERHFEAGGTFVDTLRLNLSREREALVVFLRWPRGLPASPERAEELLAALERVEPAPLQASSAEER